VSDCPNCGAQVDEGAALCPNCGYDVNSQQAGEVRRLREEGRIHPGRLGAQERGGGFAGGDPSERPAPHTELPAEEGAREGPEEIDAGL
jgi:hypothetical protein